MHLSRLKIYQSILSRSLRRYGYQKVRGYKMSSICLVTDKRNTTPLTQDAGEFMAKVLEYSKTGAFFAGTGQYYQVKDQDRIVVLNFAEDFIADTQVNLFDTVTLLDCSLKLTDVDLFMQNIKGVSNLPIYNGEVDFLHTAPWQYGFTLKPFSIFSGDERICFLKDDKIYLSNLGHTEVFDVADVDHVSLWVSDEPYNEKKLVLNLKGNINKTLISVEQNIVYCDLATLTVNTEWMMKAAALLCVNLTRKGNESAHLRLSPVLQPVNNNWVAIRQKIWIDMIQKNTLPE